MAALPWRARLLPQLNIYGTPRVAEHEAAKIYKAVAGCPASR
ncbi:hypothetical protein [Actinomadura chokoriensis]